MGSLDISVKAALLDVEGVTTPISFVHEKLFPYAKDRVGHFLRQNSGNLEIIKIVSALRNDYSAENSGATLSDTDVFGYVLSLMDQDKKTTALKELQGKIWKSGYESGEIRGEVFPDVPPALVRFSKNGLDVRIFSSGSILSQKLLFSHTTHGDLTRLLNGYFDTTTGSKTSPESYARVAHAFGRSAGSILFLSDMVLELNAARDAGMQTALCVRPGNKPQPDNNYRKISTFDELDF